MPDTSALRIEAIHRSLQLWLRLAHGGADSIEILSALTYEVGRIAGIGAEHNELSEAQVEQLLLELLDIMRGQIRSARLEQRQTDGSE